jgi:cytochrome c oxidase assembly factor 6
MGLFSSSAPAPSHTNPAPSADGAYIAPDRSARTQCWAARDAFFACLDRNGIIDSAGKEGRAEADRVCGREEGGLRRECKGSWVRIFLSLSCF